jgi:hypothetical protein
MVSWLPDLKIGIARGCHGMQMQEAVVVVVNKAGNFVLAFLKKNLAYHLSNSHV